MAQEAESGNGVIRSRSDSGGWWFPRVDQASTVVQPIGSGDFPSSGRMPPAHQPPMRHYQTSRPHFDAGAPHGVSAQAALLQMTSELNALRAATNGHLYAQAQRLLVNGRHGHYLSNLELCLFQK
jgi:hypothetical protein